VTREDLARSGVRIVSRRAGRVVSRQYDATRLIFIDADELYRDIVKAELTDEGFSVIDFPSRDAAVASIRSGTKADLILMDWGARQPHETDFLKDIRDAGLDVPVVVLAHESATAHEHLALLQGAADFIDKSRGTDIVARRVRLIQAGKRGLAAPPDISEPGRLSLKGVRIYWDGAQVQLTVGEVRIVQLLAKHAGEQVSYRQIYDALRYTGFVAGCGEEGYRANVRGAIKRIRAKFKEVDPGWEEITNFTGVGYGWRTKARKT
jgi:two-component system, OmpR family, response regulator ChvI